MADIIIYCFGAVVLLAVLVAAAWFLGALFYALAEKAAKDILRYRRLSWLRYWANRCENEGLLRLDRHYRAVSQGQAPASVGQAHEWESAATTPKARHEQ